MTAKRTSHLKDVQLQQHHRHPATVMFAGTLDVAAECWTPETAAKIIHRWNLHERLTEALRSLVGEKMPSREDFEAARAVLAEADSR